MIIIAAATGLLNVSVSGLGIVPLKYKRYWPTNTAKSKPLLILLSARI